MAANIHQSGRSTIVIGSGVPEQFAGASVGDPVVDNGLMAALLDQLRQLRRDLKELVARDPEQEVGGLALPLIDSVLREARERLPSESSLPAQIVDLISPEAIEAGEPIRAAEALVIVGQLLAALAHYEQGASTNYEELMRRRIQD